jgi:hypothetical protein
MLDGRIYRAGLVLVALALLVLGFSFQNQQPPLPAMLAPDAFSGQNVYSTMQRLATEYPSRSPGSTADYDLATQVAQTFRGDGFGVSTDSFTAQTADGQRTLENVVGTRPGVKSGSIVIVAHRDARASPATASLSGTATELELANVLSGETLQRTVVLASTSGSQGTAGAVRLASQLAGPVDAVIDLGDLDSARLKQPVIVPWSQTTAVAPPVLRQTMAAQLNQQAGFGTAGTSVFGQFVHLAFPLTLSEQAPFGDQGMPAVMLSLSGERGAPPDSPLGGPDQVEQVGRAVLSTISALDSGSGVPAPASYVLFDGKVVPGWALSMLILALIVPVAMTTIDGLARVRRRGHVVYRWFLLVLGASVPFLAVAAVVVLSGILGVLPVLPPGPVPAGTVPPRAAGFIVMIVALVAGAGSLAALRPLTLGYAGGGRRGRQAAFESPEGVVAALLISMCLVTLALWFTNPFAAALAIPALHLWLLAVSPSERLRPWMRVVALLLGLVLPVTVAVYYATTLGYSPLSEAWAATLLLAGRNVSLLAVLEWSVFFGCAVTAGGLFLVGLRRARVQDAPVTVRGPLSYAGPGSLGGTESALRR